MKKIYVLLIAVMVFATSSFAQLTGTKNIPGDYADLAAAITDLNTQGVGAGGVIFNVLAGNPQTAPSGGYQITTTTGTAANTIVFTGNANTVTAFGGQTSGNLNDAVIKLVGADYVTIQGFTIQENPANTTTAAGTNNMTEWGIALLYASATNGSQNNTIQNNTISLNRTYLNTFGIYSNTRHTATAVTATADITSATGSNSNNKVYGNSINNVNYGIVFIGCGAVGGAAFMDTGNDIGGNSLATGNTITNWGGGAAASAYVSLTGNNYCIFDNHQINDNISYNTITSAALTSAVTEGGILKNYSTLQPTGTITTSINNNTVTITNNPTVVGGGIIGVNNQGITTFLGTATINMNNNTVQNCVLGGATVTTGGLTCITNLSLPGVLNMNSNLVTNNSITATSSTTGALVGITNSGAAGVVNMNSNTVNGFVRNAGTTGQILGLFNTGAIVTTLNMNNNFIGTAALGYVTCNYNGGTGALFGYGSQGAAATCNSTIQNNDIRGITYTVDATNPHQYVSATGTPLTYNVSNNTFTNLTARTNGSVIFFAQSYTMPGNGSQTFNNNSIVTAFNKTVANGNVTLFATAGSSPNTATSNYTNNNFSNINVLGTSTIGGIISTDGAGTAATKNVTGNTFNNWTAVTGAITGMSFAYLGAPTTTSVFTNNSLTNYSNQSSISGIVLGSTFSGTGTINVNNNAINSYTSSGTGGAIVGLSSSNTSSIININNHSIHTLSSTAAATVSGITISGATATSVFKNKIYNLSNSNANPTVSGLTISGGTLVNGYNNIIGDLRTPNANAANPLVGINVTGGTTVNLRYNTVLLNATSAGALFGSSAVSVSTTPTVELRNNIFVNNSTTNGAAFTAAYRRSTTTLTSYAAASNNNLFYAGSPSASNVIFYDGTNSDQTLAAYKTRVASRDGVSVTENPPFLSTVGSNANFLHIDPTIATQIESGAATIGGITDDYDGDVRNVSTPDIGADEGNFILADLIGPNITYTPLSFTCDGTVNRTLNATITDASGVPTSGAGLPVLYWRINTGAWNSATGTSGGGSAYSFSFGIGAVTNDVIQYYIVAQDNAGTPNVSAFPSTGASGFTINPPAASTPPTTPSSYTINASLNGTYTVGATGNYTTLTAAINAYNTSCLGGPVVFSLIDPTYTTTSDTIRVNSFASATNTLTIKPAVAATITGNTTAATLVILGGDYVTIDGSIGNTANTICPLSTASRDLTISNSNVSTASAVIWLTHSGADGATNNTIKNCNIVGNAPTTTIIGLGSGGVTIGNAATTANNNNNSYINNNISNLQIGIYSAGISNVLKNSNTIINQNLINTASPNNVSRGGIAGFFENNISVSGNNISGIALAASPDVFGITLGNFAISTSTTTGAGECSNAIVTKNQIGSIRNTGTFSAMGIYLAPGATGTSEISNNMISGVSANGTSGDFSVGIFINPLDGSTTKVYYNSVAMQGTQTGGSDKSYCLAVAGGTAPTLDIRNNIFTNTLNNGTGVNYAIGLGYAAFTNITSNYNDLHTTTGALYAIGATGSISAPTNQVTFANWQTATTKDANSKNVAPVFVSATDLHLQPTNLLLNGAATPVSVTDDIDCEARDASTPDIGADEFTPPACVTAVGGTAAGNATNCKTYTGNITATGYSTGIGSTYNWVSATNLAGPWTAISGATNPASYTISPAVTVTTYFKLAVACATNSSFDSSSVVTITINPAPLVPITPAGPVNLCAPATQLLDGSGTNAATPTFQWLNNNVAIGGANSATYTATASGSYRLRVVDGVTGCFDTSVAVVVTINPVPTGVTATASASPICLGTSINLTSTVDAISPTILTENFETGATGWTFVDSSSTGANLAQQKFHIENAPYTDATGSATFLNFSIGGTKFAYSNPDIGGSGSQTRTFMVSPSFSTLGYTGTGALTFKHGYRYWSSSSPVEQVKVQITKDGGTTWTDLVNYNGADVGTTTNNAQTTVTANLVIPTAFIGQPNVQLRWRYLSNWGYYWVLDDIQLTGTPISYSFAWASNPIGYTSTLQNPTGVTPNVTTIYDVTVTGVGGCTSTASTTVTVTPPTSPNGLGATPGGPQVCANTAVSPTGTMYFNGTCDLIAKLTPNGGSPVSGTVNTCVTIDATTQTYNGQPYVTRHFDIEPATGAATATARVTLYVLQSEFDTYNANNGVYTDLPIAPGDLSGIGNLVVTQFHGTGTAPGNYTGTAELIDPADVDIIWNATKNWWEITFNVTGFSGFYVHTGSRPLPISVNYLQGNKQGSAHNLNWKVTCTSSPTATMILERSGDNRIFTAINSVTADQVRCAQPFDYVDASPLAGINYYRLKIIDANGKVTYSNTIAMTNTKTGVTIVGIAPNPVTSNGNATLSVASAQKGMLRLVVTDVTGRQVAVQSQAIIAGSNQIPMNFGKLAAGSYNITAITDDGNRTSVRFVKQ